MIIFISYFVMKVTDLERSVRFYRGIFGMKVVGEVISSRTEAGNTFF